MLPTAIFGCVFVFEWLFLLVQVTQIELSTSQIQYRVFMKAAAISLLSLFLFNLPPTEANKVEIVRQGAVGPLLGVARSHDPRVQRNATGALLNLTHIGRSLLPQLRIKMAERCSVSVAS